MCIEQQKERETTASQYLKMWKEAGVRKTPSATEAGFRRISKNIHMEAVSQLNRVTFLFDDGSILVLNSLAKMGFANA